VCTPIIFGLSKKIKFPLQFNEKGTVGPEFVFFAMRS
jgi:hypothetical protein